MVEQHGAVHTGRARHIDHVLHAAVPPPDAGGVLRRVVLGVVNHDVGAGQELHMTGVVPTRQHVTTRAQRRVERLVVGDVADDGAIAFDPIAQRQRRMVQILRPHHQIADLEGSLDQLVIGDSRAELVQGDRKIRVAHLTGKRLVQRTAKSSRPVHVPPATAKERFEERQTLDVVPVGVPEDNRSRHRIAARS